MAKDPVCGMDVDPKTATATSQYLGQTYHFCSSGCQQKFDQHPENFGTATFLSSEANLCKETR